MAPIKTFANQAAQCLCRFLLGKPKLGRNQARWPLLLFIGVIGILGNLGGCNSLTTTAEGKNDPLLGEPVLPKGVPPPTPAKTGAATPPIPPAHVSSSPAALASGSLPGSRPLAIDDPTLAQGHTNPRLPRSEPLVQPLQRGPATPGMLTTGSWVPANQAAATDPWQTQLRTRGVIWQRQDPVPEGIRFTVMVPNRLNPDSTRLYEAVARDYPSAVQAVIQQIDAPR